MMGVCRAPARSATRWRRRSPGLSDRGSPPCSGIGAQPTGAPGDARGGGRLQTCLRPPTLFQARHKTITSSLKPSNLASGTPTLALATLPLTHVKGRLRATPPKDSQPLHRTVASPWGAEVGGGSLTAPISSAKGHHSRPSASNHFKDRPLSAAVCQPPSTFSLRSAWC